MYIYNILYRHNIQIYICNVLNKFNPNKHAESKKERIELVLKVEILHR